jgi:hypothetical protein
MPSSGNLMIDALYQTRRQKSSPAQTESYNNISTQTGNGISFGDRNIGGWIPVVEPGHLEVRALSMAFSRPESGIPCQAILPEPSTRKACGMVFWAKAFM